MDGTQWADPLHGGDAVQVGEIDGVRVVWSDLPGQITCGLLARVGAADEPYLQAGITHLVEHLALFGIARPGDHTNGYVALTQTVFHTTGSGTEVVAFLDQLTRQLRDLPLDRMPAELDVLRAEYARRSGSTLLTWRFGATGYANSAQTPPALHALDAATVQAWARRRFCRENVVVFLSAPPPPGLRLHLAPAEAPTRGWADADILTPPAPDPRPSVLPALPATIPGDDEAAALLTVVPAGLRTVLLRHVYHSRLVQELRTRHAAAYSPSVDLSRLTPEQSLLTVYTDVLADRTDLAGLVVDILDDLGRPAPHERAITAAEVAQALADLEREFADPRFALAEANRIAADLAYGVRPRSHAERLAELSATTPDDLAALAREALSQAVAALPEAVPLRAGWAKAPACTEPVLMGDGVGEINVEPAVVRLVVTDDAVGLRAPDGHVTVHRDRTAALLRWPDGRRTLIGADASQLTVEPTLWQDGPALVARIDAAWPAAVAVDMPARPAEKIPQPPLPPAAAPEPAGPLPKRLWQGMSSELRSGLVMAAYILSISLGYLLSERIGPSAFVFTGLVVVPLTLWLLGTYGVTGAWWQSRRPAPPGSTYSTGKRGPRDHERLQPPTPTYPPAAQGR